MPEKRINELMVDLSCLERIYPDTKVADAVKILNERARQRDRCPFFLLVVDEIDNKEEIVGMLSMDDVLGRMESSGQSEELPIFWQGQFQQECETILEKATGEIMSPVTHVIHQSGTLMEAVHLMNLGRTDWLPVLEGGDVVGLLLKDDLFKEVVAATEPETAMTGM
jgi:CBS domain-containing protein